MIPLLRNIESRIDQTLLKYDVGIAKYTEFVERSEKYNFRALVVPTTVVNHVASISKLPVASVIGFPYGYFPLEVKLKEIEYSAKAGAKEVDVVVDIINVKSGVWDKVRNEISSLVRRSHELGLKIKVIIETSVLNDEEIIKISKIIADEGGDYVKTNTGFGSRGVMVKDVILIRGVVRGRAGIKAAGGIRSAIDAAILLHYGADIIGASRGIEIAEEAKRLLKSIG